MRNRLTIMVLLAVLVLCPALVAHHSLSAEFDMQKEMKLTGVVTKIEWSNPHVWFFIDVRGAQSARSVSWGMQLPSPNIFERQGWKRDAFKAGLTVTITGFPARDGSRSATVHDVTSAEGLKLYSLFTDPNGVRRQ